ncbi:MAG: hypothetical protein A2910_04370 [Candidatus Yanofskybacteria bacterium RIFCSPLOWO2_01_FULL_39_28]|nr:MAG: hypothetical protein A2910_04370 [Candidatus Yanofskybacteria bacterium RIFCSPLOWO2_01_FULL_39_28]
MKYLKIENNKGFYWDGKEYQEIDKIDKNGLLALLNAAETDSFELDAYDENLLGNKAHQVIYENVHTKFGQFLTDKDQFNTEVANLYNEAIGKYSADVQGENLDDNDALESSNDEEEVNPEDIPF